MGKGIVVEFNKRFNMKQVLQTKYPDFINQWSHHNWMYQCILEGRVFNLITKERYFHKPTYGSMRNALIDMMAVCCVNNITKIAMPIIGCGLDRLQWNKVSEIIKDVFKNTDIEILVCRQ
jgi:hypothetical protein